MVDLVSSSYKVNPQAKIKGDTRNNWITFMFVSKKRRNVFRKQSTIDACTKGLKELESCGFEFGPIGFGGTHVHGMVNIPQKYSVLDAKTMLKSRSAQRIFAEKPNFTKLYPDREFWSGYEHHHSVGVEMNKAKAYIKNQQRRHNVKVINDRQKTLTNFAC